MKGSESLYRSLWWVFAFVCFLNIIHAIKIRPQDNTYPSQNWKSCLFTFETFYASHIHVAAYTENITYPYLEILFYIVRSAGKCLLEFINGVVIIEGNNCYLYLCLWINLNKSHSFNITEQIQYKHPKYPQQKVIFLGLKFVIQTVFFQSPTIQHACTQTHIYNYISNVV